MLKTKKQKGFTLVELAIVLVIIGLLIGGILKGQQLMENASITATVAQVKGIEAAVTSFRDSYGELPGDLSEADSKISGCEGSNICIPTAAATARFTPGDGIIGSDAWNMLTYQPGANENEGTNVPTDPAGYETILFWYSIEKAGLITAVKEGALKNNPQAFGNSVPAAKIAGGFWVGYSDGANGQTPAGTDYTLLGTILTLVGEPAADIDNGTTADTGPVTATVAGALDRKLDDGLPDSGSVQAYGFIETVASPPDGCTTTGSGSELYNESNEKLDCGIHITIQQ